MNFADISSENNCLILQEHVNRGDQQEESLLFTLKSYN